MESISKRRLPAMRIRRWWIFAIVVGALLVMGFYTVTDPQRLSQSQLLEGADLAGYAFCHRITARSFTIAGRQLPLCARCTGMYLGVFLTFFLLLLAGRGRWKEMPPLPILLVLLGFIGIMGIDGLNSYSHFFPNAPHLYEPQNWLRLLTGMGTGLAMGLFIFAALAQVLWRQGERRAVIGSWREFGGLLLLASLAILLVLSNQPPMLYVLGLMSAAGVVLILTCLNSIILLVLLKRDAQANHWRQSAGPLFIGLVLAIGQIALIATARYALTGTLTGFPGL